MREGIKGYIEREKKQGGKGREGKDGGGEMFRMSRGEGEPSSATRARTEGEKESEIVRKSGRKSYSGNDVVAMATLSSDTPLHRCLMGIFKALR